MHTIRLIHQKLNFKGFFRPLVVLHLFTIQFATTNFVTIFLIKVHWFRLIHQNLNSKDFMQPLVVSHLSTIQFATKNCSGIFHKSAFISYHSLNTEFERFLPTPGHYTFVLNTISYKKFPSKISHKSVSMSSFSLKLNSNDFSRPLVATHLYKIQFPTKKFPSKISHENA